MLHTIWNALYGCLNTHAVAVWATAHRYGSLPAAPARRAPVAPEENPAHHRNKNHFRICGVKSNLQ